MKPWLKNFLKHFLYYILFTAITVGFIYYKGYQQGQNSLPFNLGGDNNSEWVYEVPGTDLKIQKFPNDNNYYLIKENGTKEIIKLKDVKNLKKEPFASIGKLEPIFVAGGSVGKDKLKYPELGAGLNFAKIWRLKGSVYITSFPAVYGGVNYNIHRDWGIMVGYGISTKGDKRINISSVWRF